MLEPWGWENSEYLMAAIVAKLHNINLTKGKGKPPSEFMRDMVKELLEVLKEQPDPTAMDRETLIKHIKKDFRIK